ncbi:MAG: GerMN domain-containing protein [Actinomycetota bacterium]
MSRSLDVFDAPRLRRFIGGRRRVSAFMCSAVLLSSCSIGAEDSPRTWSDWDRFDELPQGSSSGVERIYLIDSRAEEQGSAKLTTVKRDIDENSQPYAAILDVLFEGPTSSEAGSGLKSSIPAGLIVISEPQFGQGTVQVDLSEELTTALGDNLVDALAQIVWTLCERPKTVQVRILVDGRQISWPRADGTLIDRPLTPFDFPGFAATSQPNFPGIIEPPTSS